MKKRVGLSVLVTVLGFITGLLGKSFDAWKREVEGASSVRDLNTIQKYISRDDDVNRKRALLYRLIAQKEDEILAEKYRQPVLDEKYIEKIVAERVEKASKEKENLERKIKILEKDPVSSERIKILEAEKRNLEAQLDRLRSVKQVGAGNVSLNELKEVMSFDEVQAKSVKEKPDSKKTQKKEVKKIFELPKLSKVLASIKKTVNKITTEGNLKLHVFYKPSDNEVQKETIKLFFDKEDLDRIYDASIENGKRYQLVVDLVNNLKQHLMNNKFYSSEDAQKELEGQDEMLKTYAFYTLARLKKKQPYASDLEERLEHMLVRQEIIDAKDLQEVKKILLAWFIDTNYEADLFLKKKPILGVQGKYSVVDVISGDFDPDEKSLTVRGLKGVAEVYIVPRLTLENNDPLVTNLLQKLREASARAYSNVTYDLQGYFSKNKRESWRTIKKDLEKIRKRNYKNQTQLIRDIQNITDAIELSDEEKLQNVKGYPGVKKLYDAAQQKIKDKKLLDTVKEPFAKHVTGPMTEGKIQDTSELLIALSRIEKMNDQVTAVARRLFRFDKNRVSGKSVYKLMLPLVDKSEHRGVENALKNILEPLHFYNLIKENIKGKNKKKELKDATSDTITNYLEQIVKGFELKPLDKRLHQRQRALFKEAFDAIDSGQLSANALDIRRGMLVILSALTGIFPHTCLFDSDYAFFKKSKSLDALFSQLDRIIYKEKRVAQVSIQKNSDGIPVPSAPPLSGGPPPPPPMSMGDNVPPPPPMSPGGSIPLPPGAPGLSTSLLKKIEIPSQRFSKEAFADIKESYSSFIKEHEDYFKALKRFFPEKKGIRLLDDLHEFVIDLQKLEVIMCMSIVNKMKATMNDDIDRVIKQEIGQEISKKTRAVRRLLKAVRSENKKLLDILDAIDIKVIKGKRAKDRQYHIKIALTKDEYTKQLESYRRVILSQQGSLGSLLSQFSQKVQEELRKEISNLALRFDNAFKNMFAMQWPLLPSYVCKEMKDIYDTYGRRNAPKEDEIKRQIQRKNKKPLSQKVRDKKVLSRSIKKTDQSRLLDLARYRNIRLNKMKALVEEASNPKQFVTAKNKEGENALHLIASRGRDNDVDDAIRFLVLKNKYIVNVQDRSGNTPLHVALARQNTRAIRALIDAGADVSIINSLRKTPLHLAVSGLVSIGIVKKLVGEDSVNAQDNLGNTALHYAINTVSQSEPYAKKVIRLLMKNGADTSIKNKNGDTPEALTSNQDIKNLLQQK